MRRLWIYLFTMIVGIAATATADEPQTLTFDLAEKSGTQTVAAGEYDVRVVHSKPDKTYLRSNQKLIRTAPAAATPGADCEQGTVFSKVDAVAKAEDKNEADIEVAINKAVENCGDQTAALRKAVDDRTAIDLGNYPVDAAATVTIAVKRDQTHTYTIQESHLDLDLSKSDDLNVAAGVFGLRLVNTLPGQKYTRLSDGRSVTAPAADFNRGTCQGVDDALKKSTESNTSELDNALKADTCKAEADAIRKKIDAARSTPLVIPASLETVEAGKKDTIIIQRGDKTPAPSWAFNVGAKADATSSGGSEAPKSELDKAKAELAKAQIAGIQPTTSVTCKVTDDLCPAVFVSASAQSLITITDVAAHYHGPVIVTVTANETYGRNPKPLSFTREFSGAPAQLVISLHQARKMRPTYSREWFSATEQDQKEPPKRRPSNDFAIDFVTQGRSEQLAVSIAGADGVPHAINTRIKYQHWFVDTGGFLVLSPVSDEEIVTVPEGDMVRVVKKRNKDRLVPGTGAALDFHPANYPKWAVFQFALATSQDRQLSYYIGTGYRILEIGSNALATVTGGLAAVPSLRFPDVSVTELHKPDDPVLKGKTVYRFGPYISFSFGFRFGDTQPTTSNSTTATSSTTTATSTTSPANQP